MAVDLATGGGTIALAVANEAPKAAVYGTDVSKDAIKLARRNAKRLGLAVEFRVGDLFGALPKKLRGSVDVITLHPPYVASGEIEDLPDEIREWEPVHTLTDRSDDGLGLIRRTVDEAPRVAAAPRVAPDGGRSRPGAGRDADLPPGRVPRRGEHEGRFAQGDPGDRGAEAALSERTVAPYGTWRSPISAAMLVEGGVSPEPRLARGRSGVLDRGPPVGGRTVGGRPGRSRRLARRRDAGGLQRPDQGARVRRRRRTSCIAASSSRRTSPINASTGTIPGSRRRRSRRRRTGASGTRTAA